MLLRFFFMHEVVLKVHPPQHDKNAVFPAEGGQKPQQNDSPALCGWRDKVAPTTHESSKKLAGLLAATQK
jgi:hypothetical protein